MLQKRHIILAKTFKLDNIPKSFSFKIPMCYIIKAALAFLRDSSSSVLLKYYTLYEETTIILRTYKDKNYLNNILYETQGCDT